MRKNPKTNQKRHALFSWLLLLVALNATAQKNEKKDFVVINERNKKDLSVKSASFTKDAPYRKGMGNEILETHVKPKNSNHELKLLNSTTTKKQTTVERYQQYFKGIKVEQGQYTIMYDKEGKASFMNGNYYVAADEPGTETKLSIDEARDLAIASVKAETYAWQVDGMERILKDEKKDDKASYYPKGELVFVEDKREAESDRKLHLAYKFDVYATKPLSNESIYIDAADGKVLHRNSILCNTVGNGPSLYSGHLNFDIIGPYPWSICYMLDVSRGDPSDIGIGTYNAGGAGPSGLFVGDLITDPVGNFPLDPSVDVHWGSQKIYDYWNNEQLRYSYDNLGSKIVNYVHVGIGWDNAAWTGHEMLYGDGSLYSPLVSLDICSHEIGHAVCQYTANLAYNAESGAINEGLSDIWGAVIENYADPLEADAVAKNMWIIGEEITPTGLRSMSNPNSHGQPDTYGGLNWYPVAGCVPSSVNDNCGVHRNSGVLNHWFYLLSSGGSGTNDIGNAFSVTGIGTTLAAEIAYSTELLLTSTSDYSACRIASINAAIGIFGACSNEVRQVVNAWYAVGVGSNSSIDGIASVCDGGTRTLTHSSAGGTWSSSNTAVATISTAGVVTAVSPGTTIITYNTGTCDITLVFSVSPTPGTITGIGKCCVGSNTSLACTPVGYTWSSGNTYVATVGAGSGVVTGVAGGTALITYATSPGCFSTFMYTVNPNPTVSLSATTLCTGTIALPSRSPAGGTWISDNTGVATVNPTTGLITGIAPGSATITYTLPTGCFSTVSVNIVPGVAGTISGTMAMCVGASTTLSSSTTGGTWSGSTPAIGTVDPLSGIVTGISAGTVNITYTASPGCYRIALVSVNPLPMAIVFAGPGLLCPGSTVSVIDGTYGGTWSSATPAIATVNPAGLVSGLTGGVAIIDYTLTATGCFVSKNIVIEDPGTIIGGAAGVCQGATLSLSSSATGGTWSCISGTGTATIGAGTGVLTGGAAGTVTVMYRMPAGCFTTAVVNVHTMPGAITGPSNICESATITLSNPVSGGVWSNSSAANATITASGVVTGVLAGSSTISYVMPGMCYATIPFSVNTTPHFLPGSTTVCPGSAITLSASPAGGTWTSSSSPGAMTPVVSGVVTGLAAGTGIVTYSLAYPGTPIAVCSATQSLSLLPTQSISGYNSVCAASGVTLSATSPGGTWNTSNPSVATVLLSGSPYDGLLVGAPGGSYTSGTPVTVIYSIGSGCTATYNVSVYWNDDACSPCNASQFGANPFTTLPGIIAASTIAPGNYYLPGNAVIMNDVTAQDAVIFAEPGALLSVDPAYSLTSNGSHFFSCSGNMWKGIELKSDAIQTARVVLLGSTGTSGDQSTLIEDARTGILLQGAQVPNPGGPYFIDSRNAIFNKNSNGILMENYYPASGSSLPGTPDIYEIHIENTTFTSRKLNVSGYPFSWPWNYTPSGLKYNMSVPTPYESPYKIASYPYVLCNDGTPAYNGIRFKNVGNTTGGTYEGVKIGEPATATPVYGSANVEWNLFDCLGYGISGINTNLISQNNVFQESKTTLVGGIIPIGPFIEQVGIYTSMDNGRPYRLEVSPSISGASWFYTEAPNRFYNCRTGVFSMNYNKIIGLKSEMRSTQLQSVDFDSRSGYLLESSSYEEVKINENSIYNIANGVRFTSGYIPSTFVDLGDGTGYVTLDRQNLGDLEINFNRIQAALGTVAPTTQYLSQGIAVINAMPGGGYSNVTGGLHTDNNRMRDAYRGILVTGYEMQWANTRSNLITVRPDKYPKESYGICHGRNYQGAVITNTVTGTANPNDLYADNVRAYLMKSNTKSAVMCNIAENTNRGFEFQANNPDTRWTHNSMEKHMKGFVLNNAEIGPQQNAWSPCANTWIDPTWWDLTSSRFQTYVFGGPNATSSPLFYHGPAPTENGGDSPGNDYNVPGALVYTSTLPLDECSKEQPWPESGRFAVPGATSDSGKTVIQSDRQQQYTLHPNPNDGNFIISQAVTDNDAVSVVVMDMVGKILYKDAVKFIGNDHKLGLPDIASGVYVVNITDSKGRSFVFKFVKE